MSSWPIIVAGADPTGVQDSTTAIQDAITAASAVGGTVYLPPGIYLTTGLNITSNNVNLVGAGAPLGLSTTTGTIIKSTSNASIVYWANSGGGTMRGITVLGNSTGASQHGIRIACDNMVLENCAVINVGNYGFYLESTSGSRLYNIATSGTGGDGIRIPAGSNYNMFYGAFVNTPGADGVYVNSNYNCFYGLRTYSTSGRGLKLDSSTNFNKIYGLRSETTQATADSIAGSSNYVDYDFATNAVPMGDGTNGNTVAGYIKASTNNYNTFCFSKVVTPARAATGSAPGSTYTVYFSSSLFVLTLSGNIGTVTFSDAVPGETLTLVIVQPGSGNYTVGWNSNIKWAGGTPPTLNTTNNRDIFTFYADGNGNYYEISQKLNV